MKSARQIFLCGMLVVAVWRLRLLVKRKFKPLLGSPGATTTIDGKQLPPVNGSAHCCGRWLCCIQF